MKTFFALTLASVLSVLAYAAPATIEKRVLVDTRFPNYLVPARESDPYTTYSTQYTAQVDYTPDVANETTFFVGFDVPNNGATLCTLRFTLPPKVPGGYQWTVQGSGRLDIFGLMNIIQPGELSWMNRPERYPSATPLFQLIEPLSGGDATVIGSPIRCQGGQRMDFELAGARGFGSVKFDWFELTSPKSGITLEMYN